MKRHHKPTELYIPTQHSIPPMIDYEVPMLKYNVPHCLKKVKCIGISCAVKNMLKISSIYYIDSSTINSDSCGNWYVHVYDTNFRYIGNLLIGYFVETK